MIELPLRSLAADPPVPLYHPPTGAPSRRFARLVTAAWRQLPPTVSHAILNRWNYLPEGPAFGLVPSLPNRSGKCKSAFALPEGGLLIFNADWVHRRTDRQVQAVIAHELAHEYLNGMVPRRHVNAARNRRHAEAREGQRVDARVESWGFAIQSVRTWRGNRLGPPDGERYPIEALTWLVDNLPSRQRARARTSPHEGEFTRRVQLLLDEAYIDRVRQAIEGCIPHKSGIHRGTKIGYDPDNHNANCHLGVSSVPSLARKRPSSDHQVEPSGSRTSDGLVPVGSGSVAGKRPRQNSSKYKAENRASVFKKVYAEVLSTGHFYNPARTIKLIREIIADGRKAKIPESDVAETVLAAALGHKLVSSGKHNFDTVSVSSPSREDNTVARIDIKVSGTSGYTDKYDSKLGRILEWMKKQGVPAYLVIAKDHGIYLHVGIDPSETPRFYEHGSVRTKRHVVDPDRLDDAIDGKGGPVPFVKLADWHRVQDIGEATTGQIAQLRNRLRTALRSLDMKKLKRHVDKQIEAATSQNVDDLLKVVPQVVIDKAAKKDVKATARAAAKENAEVTARAAAKENAEVTARAGLAAMTPEQRAALFRKFDGK